MTRMCILQGVVCFRRAVVLIVSFIAHTSWRQESFSTNCFADCESSVPFYREFLFKRVCFSIRVMYIGRLMIFKRKTHQKRHLLRIRLVAKDKIISFLCNSLHILLTFTLCKKSYLMFPSIPANLHYVINGTFYVVFYSEQNNCIFPADLMHVD